MSSENLKSNVFFHQLLGAVQKDVGWWVGLQTYTYVSSVIFNWQNSSEKKTQQFYSSIILLRVLPLLQTSQWKQTFDDLTLLTLSPNLHSTKWPGPIKYYGEVVSARHSKFIHWLLRWSNSGSIPYNSSYTDCHYNKSVKMAS